MIEIMKASAGSGKTYSLARKYISLLLTNRDRYAYRHILAVTFTNKATDEMKGRILKELHIMASDPSSSAYRRYFVPSVFPSEEHMQQKAESVLYDILHDYSAFAVSTIDRFFQQTLKAFAREIGQFASYQVELDKRMLVAESVDRILDSLTEEDSALLNWLTDNVLEQIEQGGRFSLDANLLGMAERLKSPQRQEALEAAGMEGKEEYSKDNLLSIRKECRNIISSFKGEVKARAKNALDIIVKAGVDPGDSSYHFLSELYNYAELTDSEKVPLLSDRFRKYAPDSEKWFAKTKAKTLLPLVYPLLEAPLEDFCSLFGKEFDVYNTACILDDQLYGLGVAGELYRTYNELMREKNVLSIDDSNSILRGIIDGSDAPFVYEKTGVRYDHYLLDEFQDTARVQWQNFSPLLKESESKGGDNLIVGDVKQSIYRWRGSDWKLLQESIPSEFPGHTEKVLDTNFRSLSNIVSFNNAFFKAAASVLDRISGYQTEGPMAGIYFDVHQKVSKSDKEPGNVSFTFCPKDEELQRVLDAIVEAIDAGARLSEIAVLVRNNDSGEKVAAFLIDHSIPVITDDSLRVKSSVTVRRIVSLMSLADNPEDTVNGFLASSMEMEVPSITSLIDMVETLLRNIKMKDQERCWVGEVLYIQSFMDYVQDYVNTNGNNLRGFLKSWEEADPSISSPSSGESVRIMTIHKSKGLAFPYVILPFVETIQLYKPDSHWCSPKLEGTRLEGCADGVYDVSLSKDSVNTLFADDYKRENFLQQVDNINTLYVAMTRPALGMHLISKTPPAKCIKAVDEGREPEFKDFSQILYWYLVTSCKSEGILDTQEEEIRRFTIGEMVDFSTFRKIDDSGVRDFDMYPGNEFPSIALNAADEDPEKDARERGRLKFSADSLDFFSEEGGYGISASNRIKGVVLHDILSRMRYADDLEAAAAVALDSGEVTEEEYISITGLLRERIAAAVGRGWFPESRSEILNEATLIDTDGEMYRPDRVIVFEERVTVIDYKFGEHYSRYGHQLRKYADIWKRMGYKDVSAFIWYVHTDEVVQIV